MKNNTTLPPSVFVEEFEEKPLMDCILARDELIEEIRRFEMKPDYTSDEFPTPLTQYLIDVDYIKQLSEIIAQKIRMNDPKYEDR